MTKVMAILTMIFLLTLLTQNNRKNAAAGTERVRVAVLRQLLAEPGGWRANTLIGGTLYTRGSTKHYREFR